MAFAAPLPGHHVFTGKQKDMSEALHQFFNWDLDARLHPATFQSSHTMGLLREGTMKQQLPSSKGGRYG